MSIVDESNEFLGTVDAVHPVSNALAGSEMKAFMQHSPSIVDVAQIETAQAEPYNSYTPRAGPSFLVGCDDSVMNVTSAAAGARILFATDEWFATADCLLQDTPPHFDPNEYCTQGKVMDGWETRRRREAGHDWCVIRLAHRLHQVIGVEIDTAYFTGNNAPAISLEIADITSCQVENAMISKFPGIVNRLLHGCVQGTGHSPKEVQMAEEACQQDVTWKPLLSKTPLQPGYEHSRMHYFTFNDVDISGTHLRVNYFPDGGVARIRLWGYANEIPRPQVGAAYSPIQTGALCRVVPHGSDSVMPSKESSSLAEISCLDNGGVGLICSNKHYGEPYNLIQPGYGRDMGDGWETARHPSRPHVLYKNDETGLVDSPLSDWCILKLGRVANGGISRIILDTKYFRGNYPESVQVEGCYCSNDNELFVEDNSAIEWFPLINRVRMAPDSEHVFDSIHGQFLNCDEEVSHVRVTIFPDGGLSRVRIYEQCE